MQIETNNQMSKVNDKNKEKIVRKMMKMTTKMMMRSQARKSPKMNQINGSNYKTQLEIPLPNNETAKDGHLSKKRKHSLLQQFNRVLPFKRN